MEWIRDSVKLSLEHPEDSIASSLRDLAIKGDSIVMLSIGTTSMNVVFQENVPAQMRDGTILYADIYRPSMGGPFPVILMRLPYDKRSGASAVYRHPIRYAERGYMVVLQDTRGRWQSDGYFYPFLNEAEDGYDSVEWAAALPASNGRVGMYGTSYIGATQLQAAILQPPSLRAICPAFTGSQYYEGWAYNGGAFALAFNVSWAMGLAADTARKCGDDGAVRDLHAAYADIWKWYRYLPLHEFPPLKSSHLAPYFFDWLAHPTYDDYWKRWSIDTDYARIHVPALHIGGWYDIFSAGTVANFTGIREASGNAQAKAAQKLLVGPWFHGPWTHLTGERNFGPEARSVVDDWQLRWFDQHLKDEATGVLDSAVSVFLTGENRWLDTANWPLDGTRIETLYFHSGGLANSVNGDGALSLESPGEEIPDIYTYDPLEPVPSAGGRSCCDASITPMGPANQAGVEVLNRVLVYTSLPLEHDLYAVGPMRATLFAITSACDTDFTIKLCDVSPSGESINIQGGIVRARYRTSTSSARLVTPGQAYKYAVEMGPIAHVFLAGHRLRVQVSSSDFPQWDRNLNTGGELGHEGPTKAYVATQIVLHENGFASNIELPIARV